MAKKYLIHLDVTLSGYVEVEASNEENAKMLISNKEFQPYDVKDFYYFSKDIVDIEEIKE